MEIICVDKFLEDAGVGENYLAVEVSEFGVEVFLVEVGVFFAGVDVAGDGAV